MQLRKQKPSLNISYMYSLSQYFMIYVESIKSVYWNCFLMFLISEVVLIFSHPDSLHFVWRVADFKVISDRKKIQPTFLFISVKLDQSLFNPLSPFSMSSRRFSLFFRSSLSFGISLEDTFWLDSTVIKQIIVLLADPTELEFNRAARFLLWQSQDHCVSVLLLCSFSFSASRSSFRAICIHTSPAQAITQAARTMNRNKG